MEIVLLIAILAVAGSALYVAFTFQNQVKLLAKKADLDEAIAKAASDLSGQVTELTGHVEKLDRQIGKLDMMLGWQRELLAGIENRVRDQQAQEVDPQELEALASAMLQAEALVARDGWGQRPQLFSLATKSSLEAGAFEPADGLDPADRLELAAGLEDAEPDALIPMLMENVPLDEPFDFLATVRWPEKIVGCVLVTESVSLPRADEDVPDDPDAAEQWARDRSGNGASRLAVGVTRTGGYVCGVRLPGDDHVQIRADLADDIVAALLETF